MDGAGTVYVADQGNSTIRKITPDGVVTTLAGTAYMQGSVDGTGAAARFDIPTGVAVDSAGNVYVADQGNCTIRKITPDGAVTTLAGTAGARGSVDGTGAAARFLVPTGAAVDSAGNVYVADLGDETIRKITPAGVVTTLAGSSGMSGTADGTGAAARFDGPAGVAVDGGGNVYVADQGSMTLRKITPAGVVTTLAGLANAIGSQDGTGAAARFKEPAGVAVDRVGNVYVADEFNYTIRKVTASGVVTTLAGAAGMLGGVDGGSAARFTFPSGVAVDGAGTVYVADEGNDTIRKVTASGVVTTLAGTAEMFGSADGTGAMARFKEPAGVAVDSAGNVYVADYRNDAIRKITASGAVTTLAGAAGTQGGDDGTGPAARFSFPSGVAVDSAGNVYCTDQANDTIRKISPAGVVTTLAGAAGAFGSMDGTGPAARFEAPGGLAIDAAGNLYVADIDSCTIRKVTPSGVVTTLAGVANSPGTDDGGTAARFWFPDAVAVDSAGNVYVADTGASTIRKVTPSGVVTTLAGAAFQQGSDDGVGAAARFNLPQGVAVDSAGNIYVLDGNATIRKVTPTGSTTTIAGIANLRKIVLGAMPGFAFPRGLAIAGDALVLSDADAILLFRHVVP